MPTTKKLATWLWTQLKSEMRFQKAPPVPASYRSVKFEVQMPRKPGWVIAIQGLVALILVPVIFVILALMIGL